MPVMQTEQRLVSHALPALAPPTTRPSSLIQEAILATLAYHDLLGMPLTAVEVWRFLIRPRVGNLLPPPLREITEELSVMVSKGTVQAHQGYIAFPGREDTITARIERHARAQEKWKRLRRIVFWLQAIPFLRMVAGSGSLAREVVREESDLDVLVVAATGHIWTVRFLVTVLLDLFHLRRRPTGPTQDLVCLNHYLALDGLELPYHSLYTAYEYVRLVPLLGEHVLKEFHAANRSWIETCLLRVLPEDARHQKQVAPSPVLRRVQRICEWMLLGPIGNVLERTAGAIQYRRIAAGTTIAKPGRVVASARALEFHPHSHEAPLLATFNTQMFLRGLEAFGGQEDSGLDRVEPPPAHSS